MKIIVSILIVASFAQALDFMNAVFKQKKLDTLHFKKGSISIYCNPHGTYTITQFLNDETVDNKCKSELLKLSNNIQRRYGRHLNQRLHLEQTYHLRSIDNQCVVFFNDNKTYSQTLVENGLAVVKKGFQSEDKWFEYRLNKAQELAQREKRGIWSTPFLAKCFEAVK